MTTQSLKLRDWPLRDRSQVRLVVKLVVLVCVLEGLPQAIMESFLLTFVLASAIRSLSRQASGPALFAASDLLDIATRVFPLLVAILVWNSRKRIGQLVCRRASV